MNWFLDWRQPPSPEQLTAYADGELGPGARRRVGWWLRAHPDAAELVRAQRRLSRLMRSTRTSEPCGPAWAVARRRAFRLDRARRAGFRIARVLPRGWAASLSVFAAAGVVLSLTWDRPGAVEPVADVGRGPLPVASAAEVEVISLAPADGVGLVVGEPPLQEALVTAGRADIKVTGVERGAWGFGPRLLQHEASASIIVAPWPAERDEKADGR